MTTPLTTDLTNSSSRVLNLEGFSLFNAEGLLYDTLPSVNEDVFRLVEVQSIAVLAERERLAQNLHDAINQSLFSASLIAEVLPRLWERDSEAGREALADLRGLIRGALADVREVLADLHPVIVSDADFKNLLHQLCDALTGRTNIPVNIVVVGQGVLPANVQAEIYALSREALNNIAKHAGATQVDIRLQYQGDGVELAIRDDGRGFDSSRFSPFHFGLSIMHQRAEAIGAALAINSEPGHGTEVAVRWPGFQSEVAT